MDLEKLDNISASLAHARNLLDELERCEEHEDNIENWLYAVESIETEIDSLIEELKQ